MRSALDELSVIQLIDLLADVARRSPQAREQLRAMGMGEWIGEPTTPRAELDMDEAPADLDDARWLEFAHDAGE